MTFGGAVARMNQVLFFDNIFHNATVKPARTPAMSRYSVLFVCTDNQCRSPTAEGVLRHKLKQHSLANDVLVASVATHDLNTGEPIDYHAQKHAMRRDFDLSGMRSHLLQAAEFEFFDLIVAMDESNLVTLRLRCPAKFQHKLRLFTEFASDDALQDVPDPYYGQPKDFEQVLDLIDDGCNGLVRHLQEHLSVL